MIESLKKKYAKTIDYIVSHLPEPFFTWSINLFMPKLKQVLRCAKKVELYQDKEVIVFQHGKVLLSSSGARTIEQKG